MNSIPIEHMLFLSTALFFIGMYGHVPLDCFDLLDCIPSEERQDRAGDPDGRIPVPLGRGEVIHAFFDGGVEPAGKFRIGENGSSRHFVLDVFLLNGQNSRFQQSVCQ